MYRRITTYLYSYDKGKRLCNQGYCRFDIGECQIKINVGVKVPDKYTWGIAHIYLLRKEGECFRKILLGKTCGLNGSICYRYVCDKSNLPENSGVDEIKGILIYDGESMDRCFAGMTDKDEFDFSLIISDEINHDELNEDELNEDKLNGDEFNGDELIQDEKVDIGDSCDECILEENKQDNTIWQELLFSSFPKVRVDFGGKSCEAIRLRPHDLVWFPRKYWHFSNNKYLLNEYYNHRYIMLVRGVDERKGSYYLAVPGKRTLDESIMARKNGFSEYVNSNDKMGFWCFSL